MTIVSKRKTQIIGAVGLALIVIAIAMMTFGRSAFAQPGLPMTTERTITVSGIGQAFGTPDTAYITFGVDRVSADINESVSGARDTLADIIAALEAAGVERADIQTTNFNVYPEDRFNPTTGQPTGERTFRTTLGVSVTVRDLDETSTIITAALDAGANRIDGLSFGIADVAALETEARTSAAANARARADELAAAFEVSVGEVVNIVEGSNFGGIPLPAARQDMGVGMGGNMQIVPGQLSVTVQVTVTYTLGG
ncbi:MAG: SIMPL domain-containing protein [Chloroflexota bacterium]|nr:SIMPL domain-containing protein [Chloroflexota bacterium]